MPYNKYGTDTMPHFYSMISLWHRIWSNDTGTKDVVIYMWFPYKGANCGVLYTNKAGCYQSSCLNGVRLWAFITFQTLKSEIWGPSRLQT